MSGGGVKMKRAKAGENCSFTPARFVWQYALANRSKLTLRMELSNACSRFLAPTQWFVKLLQRGLWNLANRDSVFPVCRAIWQRSGRTRQPRP